MTSIMHLVKSGEHVIVHDRVYAGIQRYFKNFSVLKYNVNI
jgi:cystathionine beta-lyase/cystathionine gamma-synthase